MKTRLLFICCLTFILLAGCASPTVELKRPHPYGSQPDARGYSWHHLRFQWAWPEDRRPDWSLDPLAADLILSDLITRYQASLPLWRFHRRAARTPSGHQFSFIFYTSPDIARRIRDAAADHPVTRELRERGVLQRVHMTRPDQPSKLLATSDGGWPESVQKSWPMFIMGVSQTWLALVELHAGDTEAAADDLDAAMARYEQANEKLDELWYEYAQHAFFHHISGVFGYSPVKFRKPMRF